MYTDAQPIWLEALKPTALNSLSVVTNRNREGSDAVLLNPAYEQISDSSIHESLFEILDSVNVTDKLLEIELSNQDKFGPRSVAKPWSSRRDSVYAYFDNKSDEVPDPAQFSDKNGALRPISFENATALLDPSKSAGLPFMVKKGLALKELVLDDLEPGIFPSVLFTRTAEQEKTRNVWGYPLSDTIAEMRIFSPWLEVEKRLSWRAALLGPEEVDIAISKLLLVQKKDSDLVVGVDFTAYDASVDTRWSIAAFKTISKYFQASAGDHIATIANTFTSNGIWTPDGEISGPHGVPSGSVFTNSIDSIVQMMIATNGGKDDFTRDSSYQIQGDDGIYLIDETKRDGFLNQFKEAGLEINDSKSEVFTEPEAIYLQRYYHSDYRARGGHLGGVYSIFRAMARIKYLEHWTDFDKMGIEGSDFFSLRTITILENCKHHPGFVELVKFAQSLDKNGLHFTKDGENAWLQAMKPSVRAGYSYATDVQNGIESFETVKLLRS